MSHVVSAVLSCPVSRCRREKQISTLLTSHIPPSASPLLCFSPKSFQNVITMIKSLLFCGVLGVFLIPAKSDLISVCIEDDQDLRVDCMVEPKPSRINSYEFSWSSGKKEAVINTNVSGAASEAQFRDKSYVEELESHGYRPDSDRLHRDAPTQHHLHVQDLREFCHHHHRERSAASLFSCDSEGFLHVDHGSSHLLANAPLKSTKSRPMSCSYSTQCAIAA
ncbi:hypothetical protein WMY93_008447 [Mugilogobius chulae]|uniref:Ig-like domain-containing protein n=1 Tax=Mugilogobius chulae TaxID=88201 RepID=A0AAW0PSL3_9GOBI